MTTAQETAAQDTYLHMIGAMRYAAGTCRTSATDVAARARQHQIIADNEQAEATYMLELADRWDRVIAGVERGVITLDDVIVSLDYAEERLAARTVDTRYFDDHDADEGPLLAWERDIESSAAQQRLFAVDDVVNVADGTGAVIVNRTGRPPGPLDGRRGTVTAIEDGLVTLAIDNLGSTLSLPPQQLMHHEDWISLDVEVFDAAAHYGEDASIQDTDDLAAIDGAAPMVLDGFEDFDPFWSASSEGGC